MSQQTLYRKYRPQTFKDIAGQEHIKTAIKNEIINNCLAHAFLFCGPRGIGKTSLARLIAKTINCETRKEDEAEPCNVCENCKEITSGRSLDIIEIDAASQTGVDNVRENIIANSKIGATTKKNKVFIIDEVHMLSTSSFNALLKTLEEPPRNVIFILATTEIHKIPQTIISRCQRFDFQRIQFKEVVSKLKSIITQEEKDVEDDVVNRIAKLSGGYLRDSLSLLGQVLSLGDQHINLAKAELILPSSQFGKIIVLLEHLLNKKVKEALVLVNLLAENGVDITIFYEELIETLRNILLFKVGIEKFFDCSDEEEKQISGLVKNVTLGSLVNILNVLLQYKQKIRFSHIEILPLELALLEICGVSEVVIANNEIPSKTIIKEIKKPKEIKTKIKKNEIKEPIKVVSKSVSADSTNSNDLDKFLEKPEKVDITVKKIEDETQKIEVGHVDIEEIKQKWSKVLAVIKKKYHSLLIMLNTCQVNSSQDGVITLGCKYSFYHEQLKNINNRVILEKIISEVIGKKSTIEVVFDNSVNLDEKAEEVSEVEESDDDGMNVADLASAFGGEVL